ncbi:rhomboid family intramembrane serine protease [Dysgonomonas sp.]|jgi:membrane associated rhomboid family serine protease
MNRNNTGFASSIPPVTLNLLIINVLLWVITALFSSRIDLTNLLGLHYVTSDLFMPHQLITHMFMHGSTSHVFFNMFAVFMFGSTLERTWGSTKYLVYYILTGLGAAALQLLIAYIRIQAIEADLPADLVTKVYAEGANALAQNQNFINPLAAKLNDLLNIPMVGASGAVFGLLVAFGMLFPNVELIMLFFPVPIKAKWFVIGYGVMELVLGVLDNAGDNVAHFAHLGGLITGFIIILYWRKKAKSNGRF